MSEYSDIWYRSDDGLQLYARDYPCRGGDEAAKVVLCMHGLTRNSADFGKLAAHLSERYRVLAVDVRGRGRSERDPNPANYTPLTYSRDMFVLLDLLDLPEVVLCGTSMGGLMAMLMAATQPARVSAIILNDIGPEVDPRGLERIQAYVGKPRPAIATWPEAAQQAREINAVAFPEYGDEEWLEFARLSYREVEGVPVPAYDPAIAQPLQANTEAAVPPDLWPVFGLLQAIPLLVIRGEISDLLASECVEQMQARKPDVQVTEIPGRGHAPSLDEPAARQAIDSFLQGIN